MTDHGPVLLVYEGDGRFRADNRYWAGRCEQQFGAGEAVQFERYQPRSMASHAQQFAWLADVWKHLPERFKNEPWAQTPEHLRKFALIRTGFCDTQTFPCGSRAEAERWVARLRPFDEYSIVLAEGTTVVRYTAQSQAKRAMGARRFQESKNKVFDYVAELIGVHPDQLAREVGFQRASAKPAPPSRSRERLSPADAMQAG